jgi:two-component system response regulator FlrC
MTAESTILIVEDDVALGEALRETLALEGLPVTLVTSAEQALSRLAAGDIRLVISDMRMEGMSGLELLREIRRRSPQLPVLLMTAFGTVNDAVDAMREGAIDYIVKPFDPETLLRKLRALPTDTPATGDDPVTQDARMCALVDLATRVAGSEVTVLLTGESGTGKEVLARLIHRRSRRAGGPFVAINCAAIPENMLEAMLFGYEKGAYTGAHQSAPGKFEQAQGGTLLLDEITEMPLPLQAKLLRVLQEREVERLGSRRTIALDVRVLATTNRDLRHEVANGRFREDLYYRLNVFPLALPPLRARREDILPLARHFLARHSTAAGRRSPRLSADAEQSLLTHAWLGNVRELDNLMQRALILQSGEWIRAADLRFEPDTTVAAPSPLETASAEVDEDSLGHNLKNHERDLIIEALRAERGRRKDAAARLGISPRTLRYKLARLRESGMAIPV